jgi:uncharacterized protein YunC (DUF1805 family)
VNFVITVSPLEIDGKNAIGLKVDLPNSPPLLAIIGRTGFVMCGFLNTEAAEKFNVAAAVVSGVRSFEDVLKTEIKKTTSKGQLLGVKLGMTGKEAIKAFL